MNSIVQKLALMWGQLDDEWRGVIEEAISEIEGLKAGKDPLGDEELRNIARSYKGNTQRRFEDHWSEIVSFVRDVECAHGIVGKKEQT
jgi:hypothetical protein